MRNIGFQDIELDTYLVVSHDTEGKEFLEIKELVVTAHKPKKAAIEQDTAKRKKSSVDTNLKAA